MQARSQPAQDLEGTIESVGAISRSSAMTHSRPMPINVRHANHSDNVLLSEIGAETFAGAFGPHNTPHDMRLYLANAFSPEIQAAELADPTSVFLIAETEGQAVGYARLREGRPAALITGTRPVEIVRFYARPDWIGRGVGAALMQACLSEAERGGFDTIWLDVWEENRRARAFYVRWAFEEVGTQPFRLGDEIQTDILMQRPVLLSGEE